MPNDTNASQNKECLMECKDICSGPLKELGKMSLGKGRKKHFLLWQFEIYITFFSLLNPSSHYVSKVYKIR